MLNIGLTGGIGSGKSTLARELERLGAVRIDADEICRQLTAPQGAAIEAIRREFGDEYIDGSGAMDRARMRELVFADPASRTRLEGIIHPALRLERERLIAAATGPYIVHEIPLLVEKGIRDGIDRVLVVDCPEGVQVARVMARSGLAESEVRRILASQASRQQRLAAADDVFCNTGNKEALCEAAKRLDALYRKLAA